MAVYVDALFTAVPKGDTPLARQARRNGTRWCHLFGDTPEELHAMAARLGLQREWFQPRPEPCLCHYDLVPGKRALAVRLGALEVSTRAHLRRCRGQGSVAHT